jgi:hypothetical protein
MLLFFQRRAARSFYIKEDNRNYRALNRQRGAFSRRRVASYLVGWLVDSNVCKNLCVWDSNIIFVVVCSKKRGYSNTVRTFAVSHRKVLMYSLTCHQRTNSVAFLRTQCSSSRAGAFFYFWVNDNNPGEMSNHRHNNNK